MTLVRFIRQTQIIRVVPALEDAAENLIEPSDELLVSSDIFIRCVCHEEFLRRLMDDVVALVRKIDTNG